MMMITATAEENPFFLPFNTPHGTAPFNEIKITHYEPAFEKAMTEHQAESTASPSTLLHPPLRTPSRRWSTQVKC